MARRKKGDDELLDGLELEGYVLAGTEAAFDTLGPREAETPHCVRCGSPISHVFVTSKGPMGGDCLATLTGDQSTRRLARQLTQKLNVEMGYREVSGLEVKRSLSYRSEYAVSAVSIDRRRYDEYTGLFGERTHYLMSCKEAQLPVMLAIAANEAELRGLKLDLDHDLNLA